MAASPKWLPKVARAAVQGQYSLVFRYRALAEGGAKR
jgi:hypothetical protein